MKPSWKSSPSSGALGSGQRNAQFRRRALFALFLVVVPLLASCTLPPPLNRTLRYTLSARAADLDSWGLREYKAHKLPYPDCMGLPWVGMAGDDPLAAGDVYVGFEHIYKPGTPPLACWVKQGLAYRATVVFDLSEIRRLPRKFVKHAEFTYDVKSSLVCTPGGLQRCTRNTDSCVSETLVAEVSPRMFTGALPPGDKRALPTRGDVTAVVRRWVDRQEPNFGFVLRGRDETFPENNAACLSTLTNFVLTVDVLLPPVV